MDRAAIWSVVGAMFGSWPFCGRVQESHVRRRQRMHGAIGHGVAQAADDGELLLEILQRREDGRQREVPALGGRRPLLHDGAVGEVDESEPRLARRGGRAQRGGAGNHRVEQWQRHRHARAAQHGAPGEMFLGDEHRQSPSMLSEPGPWWWPASALAPSSS